MCLVSNFVSYFCFWCFCAVDWFVTVGHGLWVSFLSQYFQVQKIRRNDFSDLGRFQHSRHGMLLGDLLHQIWGPRVRETMGFNMKSWVMWKANIGFKDGLSGKKTKENENEFSWGRRPLLVVLVSTFEFWWSKWWVLISLCLIKTHLVMWS